MGETGGLSGSEGAHEHTGQGGMMGLGVTDGQGLTGKSGRAGKWRWLLVIAMYLGRESLM
jgi:hypothetical protein